MADMVCIGAIAGAFGVRGEVRLKSFCAQPEAIASYGPLSLSDGRTFTVKITRPVKGGFAVRLEGIASKEAADALRGERVHVPRDHLPEPEDEEYYHADLIGLEVLDPGGASLGRITAVHDHGAGDLLEVAGPGLKGSIMLPFTRAAVPTVDLAAGLVIADPPAGLFPGNEDD